MSSQQAHKGMDMKLAIYHENSSLASSAHADHRASNSSEEGVFDQIRRHATILREEFREIGPDGAAKANVTLDKLMKAVDLVERMVDFLLLPEEELLKIREEVRKGRQGR
jgi:hypothetical protein